MRSVKLEEGPQGQRQQTNAGTLTGQGQRMCGGYGRVTCTLLFLVAICSLELKTVTGIIVSIVSKLRRRVCQLELPATPVYP